MTKRNGKSSFLRELSINILGTFIGAILALASAFYFYNYESKKNCNDELRMMQHECDGNIEVSKLILDNLSSIKKEGQNIRIKPISLHFSYKATNIAATSEDVLRFTSPNLRRDINNHSEILITVNYKLESFNNFVYGHIDDSASYQFINEWVNILKNDIENISKASEDLSNRIKLYFE